MKKIFISLCIILLMVSFTGIAGAVMAPSTTTYTTFTPSPADLDGLDHGKYYRWGINFTIPEGQKITGASLFFDDIRNSDNSNNDLWITLLKLGPSNSVTVHNDNNSFNNFNNAINKGNGILLYHYEDLSNTAQDITFTFDYSQLTTLNDYLSDGNFGIGFDPDCHFYNSGISLTIETSPVPIPASIFLLAPALLGVVGFSRKRNIRQHI